MRNRSTDDENPALYDVARQVCHEQGIPWTDPRTGVTYPPPADDPDPFIGSEADRAEADFGDDVGNEIIEDDEPPENTGFGPCCVCETTTRVRNVLMLHTKAPIAGRGWGCVVCGLPSDGAIAVVCDACLGAPLKFACRGYAKDDGRIPIAELTGTHEHDLARHRD